MWVLPIAVLKHGQIVDDLMREFEPDFASAGGEETQTAPWEGDPYRVGIHVDQWGSRWTNYVAGIIGEVKEPLVEDWETDQDRVHIPYEALTMQPDAVNRQCAASDKFVFAGACPQPFERLQYLRTSEELYMDLMDMTPAFRAFLAKMHAFHCELMELWAKTDVDALRFNDDWGSQRSLLIRPELWREIFRPMYQDFAQIASSHGKHLFMHSDGYILDIYEDLISMGIKAVNSQIACMGVEALAPFAGKITFWGEIDRQYLLSRGSVAEVEVAVREIHAGLWKNGGCIAQCEFGAEAKPENVRAVYETWNSVVRAG